jgi:hypothetical protein
MKNVEVIIFKNGGRPLLTRETRTFNLAAMVRAMLGISSARLTTVVSAGTTATATTEAPHGLATGDIVTIRNAENANHNVEGASITVTGLTTFTFTVSSTTATSTRGYLYEQVIEVDDEGMKLRRLSVTGMMTELKDKLPSGSYISYNAVNLSGRPEVLVMNERLISAKAHATDLGTITSITRSSTTATVTCVAEHGLVTGDLVTVAGAVETDYNITASITVTGLKTFTYTVANSPSTPATGTVTIDRIYTEGQFRLNGVAPTQMDLNVEYETLQAAVDVDDEDELRANSLSEGDTGAGITMNNKLITTEPTKYSAATGITAFATGGQGSATQLTEENNEVTTCATGNDSVKLPSVELGLRVSVKNDGAAMLAVFPFTGDTINDGSANASILIPPGANVTFYGISATNWETDNQAISLGAEGHSLRRVSATQIGVYNGTTLVAVFDADGVLTGALKEQVTDAGIPITGFLKEYTETAITAHAGGGQASAYQIAKQYTIFGTVATNGDSAKLPAAPVAGQVVVVYNSQNNYVDLFPGSGDTIDAQAADTAVKVGAKQHVTLRALSASAWETVGSTVTIPTSQGTNITTGVTVNAKRALITTQAATAGAAGATPNTFTVTNSYVRSYSTVRAWIQNYSGTIATNGVPVILVDNIVNGAFDVIIANAHGTNAVNGTLDIGIEVLP